MPGMTQGEFQARKERSAQRKRELAARLDSNELLIAAVRFYLAVLLPTRRAEAAQVHERTKDFTRRWKTHLRAARRVLGIMILPRSSIMTMPQNWWRRLARIGLELTSTGFFSADPFFRLNPDLEIDSELTTYETLHPQILDGARRFLCGGDWPPRPEPPQLGVYDQHLRAYIQGGLRELLFEREL